MNKHIENAMAIRETAAVSTQFRRGLDVIEGDIVQIRPPGHNSGRLGVVIGISYYKKHEDMRYTVKFSDHEAALFSEERLELVRHHDSIE